MADEIYTYSIIVRGSMNPPIHHPTWYLHVGLLNEDAVAVALQSNQFLCGTPISQFSTATMTIQCFPDNWTLQTTRRDSIGDAVSLTAELFDGKLPHTPVQAVGFNVAAHVNAGSGHIEALLGSLAPTNELGIDWFQNVGAGYTIVSEIPDCRIRIQIEPSLQVKGFLFLSLNFHYSLKKRDASSIFVDIGPVLKGRYLENLDFSDRVMSSIVKAIIERGQ
ncbi:MAG: hypothetical protein IT365_14700 [Candidatus Hydrogenedentes bacterium]|nr:hypothetical protein [Candidatus Hydrogenedentota bacterium]